MLAYNEIKPRKYIVYEGDPYECLESNTAKKNRQKPVNQTKLRNLINGSIKQIAFHQSDMLEEAVIEKKTVVYIFHKYDRQTEEEQYWFHTEGNRADRFSISAALIGDKHKWLKENSPIDALYFKDQVIGVELPIKINLKVTEAAPAVKGNTATGAYKTVVLETGAEVLTPLFINEGDVLTINTESGEYVERAK